METLFNLDADGSLIVSAHDWSPEEPPAEIRIPAKELAALRAILDAPALARCQSSDSTAALFHHLHIFADENGITLEQTRTEGMGGTDSRIDLTLPQLWPAITELARLASRVTALAGSETGKAPRD